MRILARERAFFAPFAKKAIATAQAYAHKCAHICMNKKAHNTMLRPEFVEVFREFVIPKTRSKSVSDFLDNEIAKTVRRYAPEIRKSRSGATPEQRATIDRVLEEAFAK